MLLLYFVLSLTINLVIPGDSPSTIHKIFPINSQNFTLNNVRDVLSAINSNRIKHTELLPIIKNVVKTITSKGQLTHEGQLMLNKMLINITRLAEASAKTDKKDKLTKAELKKILRNLGLKEGETTYDVSRTQEGQVDIDEEEIETDDPNAEDEVIFDFSKTVDKTVNAEGVEKSDEELKDKQY